MAEVEHVVSADGTRIGFRAWGEGDPIVFVHGMLTTGGDWHFVMPKLRDRFRVVVMDRRGRGRSEDVPEYAIEREAEDVLAVLDAAGAEILVGHSYGAMCSILAAERTDRLRRLVLYEPPIGVNEDHAVAVERLVAQGDRATAAEMFLRNAGAGDAEIEQIRSAAAWSTLLEGVPALPREFRESAAWRDPAGPIEVPTLFLLTAGNRNPSYTSGLDQLLSRFSDLRREEIPGPNHLAHIYEAERFAALVADFCDS